MRRTQLLSRAVWLLGAVACNGIVGIEDLHDGPRPGAGGTEGSSAGTSSNGGKPSSAGKNAGGSSTNEGGTSGSSPVEGGSDTGPGGAGASGEGPGPVGGEGGEPPVVGDPTVRGHVIDFWGHKVPNVPIKIGSALTSTDETGAFEIPNVAATYDASLVATYTFNTVDRVYAYVYQGLTRRDPTLQVIAALPPTFGKVQITQQNAVVGANQTISVAFGGPDGNTDLSGLNGTVKSSNVTWEGGETNQQTAHGLFFQEDPINGQPTSYLAYDSTNVSLSETITAKFTLDLANGAVDSSVMQGTVTPAAKVDRANHVYLHYSSGATQTLVDDYNAASTFSYLVPSIPGSTITAVATEGDNSGTTDGFFALARVGGLSPTSKPALKIPAPATLTSPAVAAENVTTKTGFAFQSPASNPGPFMIQIENTLEWSTIYIITAAKQFTIPEQIAGDFALLADSEHAWRVATHGKLGSVDAMAGPNGFLQPFDNYNDVPYGPLQGDGEFTRSATRYFRTAP
jgi:hypothetical protein